MKAVPVQIQHQFDEALITRGVSVERRAYYVRWLKLYWNFCWRRRLRSADTCSLQPFLQYMAKRYTPEQQRMAAQSVCLHRHLMNDTSSDAATLPSQRWMPIYKKLKSSIRLRNYSSKTYTTYTHWIGRFQGFVDHKDPDDVDSDDARRFLSDLAERGHVAASTQNQAFHALLYLYTHILKKKYDMRKGVTRAKQMKYIPVVLSRPEVDQIIAELVYPFDLIVQLLYGSGLRQGECLNLRLHALNFDEAILTVHDGKGQKDRTVPLPKVMIPALRAHMNRVRKLHDLDCERGYAGVFMERALERKWKNGA